MTPRTHTLLWLGLLSVVTPGCVPKATAPQAGDEIPGTMIAVDVDLDALAEKRGNKRVRQLLDMKKRGHVDPSAGIFIPFTGPLNVAALPQSVTASMKDDSKVVLVVVDPKSPKKGTRLPVEVRFKDKAETYTPANTLVVLPYQGAVPQVGVQHAVIVRRSLKDAKGEALGSPAVMGKLKAGAWKELLEASKIPLDDIATAYVFTPNDPTERLRKIRDHLAAGATPAVTGAQQTRTHDEFCVIEAKVALPIFQSGAKPYSEDDTGRIVVDDEGRPVAQGHDEVPIALAIPRKPMPAAGFPVLVFGNGGGGKHTQVIDRNQEPGAPEKGHGPARELSHHGIASVGFPAPLAWSRNPAGGKGTLQFWNINNLEAFAGNVEQGALDFTGIFKAVQSLQLNGALCPEAKADVISFDAKRKYLWGHSTGSTIGSLVAELERPNAVVFSGAGGSWIYNLAMADSPIVYRKVIGGLVGHDSDDEVDRFDYVLSLFQHAMAGIEVMNWGQVRRRNPGYAQNQDMLLIEGVNDTYHYPRMVHAYAMAADLDLATPTAEETAKTDFALVGNGVVTAPVAGHRNGTDRKFTAVTLQRTERPGIDGHYVPFAWPDVKHRWACFFATHAADGVAKLVAAQPEATASSLAPCSNP